MQKIPLSNKQYFTILWSWINEFEWEKNYYSTSSIKWTEILEPEEIITYKTRPSRANMQPLVGVVCFAKMSQTLKVFKIDEDLAKSSILSTWFSLILPNKELVSSEYLKYYFLSSDFNSDKDSLSTGTTQVAINNDWIKKIEIPLPSLPTQHLIVSEIEKQFSRLDEWLLSLRRAKENLKKYKASVLKSAVEWKLTEDFRKTQKLESASILLEKILEERKKKFLSENPGKKYKEPEGIKQEDLPNIELPEGWEWSKISQLFKIIWWWTPSTNETNFWNWDIPWITSADIYWIKNIEIRKYITKDAVNNSATNLTPPWTIIVVTRVWLWKIAITDKNICFNQDCQWLIDQSNLLNKDFVLLFLSVFVKKFIYESRWTTIPWVTKKQLEEIIFPLPPLSEQNEIVKIVESKLSVVEKLEKLVDENIKRSENLKQSILKKAFEGELVREE